MRNTTRANIWRLLDTAGGVALGMLLLLGAQAWLTPHASQAASQAPSVWSAGPWAGCTLLAVSQSDMSDGQNTITHQVSATWACAHALPPALLTPASTPPAR